jgi:5-methylcytosine-specific restriction endonuclease McrA
MKQSTLDEYQSTGVECPKCDYKSGSYAGLGGHWRHHHEGIPPWKKTECEYCGNVFSRSRGNKTDSENEFCSRECYHGWNKETGALAGENNPQYKEPLLLECEQCSCDYEVPPVHSESRFCSAECRHDWLRQRTGTDHPLHQGGYDYYVAIRQGLSDVGWETLRKEHNADECEMCGAETSPNDRDLSLHHILPVLSGGTNEAYNFMTLCEPCHSKAEAYCSDLPGFDRVLVE